MRYQAIEGKIWFDDRFCSLTPMQQRLFLYLLTCPHGNFLGIFVLKPAYAQADLGYSTSKEYLKDLEGVCGSGMVYFDNKSSVLWVKNLIKYGSQKGWNEKHKKGAEKTLKELPTNTLIKLFSDYYGSILEGVEIHLSIPLSKGYGITEPEPEPEPRPGPRPGPGDGGYPHQPPICNLSPTELAEIWNQKAPSQLSRVIIPLNGKRKEKALIAIKTRPDPEFWIDTCLKIIDQPFLLGANDRKWMANFDFILTKYDQVAEGKYKSETRFSATTIHNLQVFKEVMEERGIE